MAAKKNVRFIKKQLQRTASCLALAGLMLMASPQPAHAQLFTTDILQQITTAWSTGVNSATAYIHEKMAAANTDNINQNAKNQAEATKAMDIATSHALPPGYSACRISQSIIAGEDNEAGRRALAQAMATTPRPLDPSMNAKDIRAALNNGLVPCTSSTSSGMQDSEYAVNHAMGCQQKWGGQYERADRTINAMFADTQFPVPPNFVLPTNGVTMPMPTITDQKYMKFAAAYSLCQRISPRVPGAVQISKMSIDAASAGPHADAEAVSSGASSTCMDQLLERAQYGSGSSITAFQNFHTNQVTQCQDDAQDGLLDGDPQYVFDGGGTGSCSSDGRSALRKMLDDTHRGKAQTYHGAWMAGATASDWIAERRSLIQEQVNYQDYIRKERADLEKAIADSQGMQQFQASPLAVQVTPQ